MPSHADYFLFTGKTMQPARISHNGPGRFPGKTRVSPNSSIKTSVNLHILAEVWEKSDNFTLISPKGISK